MTLERQAAGKTGEDLAVAELERRGYAVLARRYRSRHGEIDIVCNHRGTIVFVEVKARATGEFGAAAEAVTPGKQRRVVAMARDFLARHNLAWRLIQGASGPHAVRLNPSGPADTEGRIGFLLDLMLQPAPGEVDPRMRRKLTEFVAIGEPKGPAADRRVREAAHAIATLPLFQMA